MKKKKKKVPIPESTCYSVDLRRWITISEAIDRIHSPEKYKHELTGKEETPRDRRKRKLIEKLSDVILEVIEDAKGSWNKLTSHWNDSPPPPYRYYGLDDALLFEEMDANAINTADMSRAVQSAWRRYRELHPKTYRPLPSEYEEKVNRNPVGEQDRRLCIPKKNCNNYLFGIKLGKVIRKMGKEGFTFEETKIVLKHFNIDAADKTIRSALWCGKQKGKYGKAAKLTEKQLNELYEALSKGRKTKKIK